VPGPTPMGKLHSLLSGQEGPGGEQHGIPKDGQEGPEKVHQEEGLEDMVIGETTCGDSCSRFAASWGATSL
jgi:hypothetical protein